MGIPTMGKDPNAPKRPGTAYILWCNDNRVKAQKANPDASMTGLSKILGAMWKEAPDAEKKKYKAIFDKAKAEYDVKMEKYKQTDEYKAFSSKNNVGGLIKRVCKKFNIECKKRNPTSFPSDPNAPKKAKSGFMLFCDEKRPSVMAKLKGQPVSAVAKELGAMWKTVSSSELAKYNKQAESSKTKRAEVMKKYEKSDSYKNYVAARKEY